MKIVPSDDCKKFVNPKEMIQGVTYRNSKTTVVMLRCCGGWVDLTNNRIITRVDSFVMGGTDCEWCEVKAEVVIK